MPISSDVCEYVKKCVTCQRFRGETGLQRQWKELPPVSKSLERVGIDLPDMVACNHSYSHALTVVDYCSRFVRFFPRKTKHPTHIYTLYGSMLLTTGHSSGQRRKVHLQRDSTVLSQTKHHIVLQDSIPPLGQQHQGADAKNSQVGSGDPPAGPSAPLAPATPTLSDHDESGSTHLHRTATLLRFPFTPPN